jgi:hypothetical protein
MIEVTLKNGSKEPDVLIAATMLSLRDLLARDPITFYEAVMVARDRDHRLFGTTGVKLVQLGLLSRRGDGSYEMHDSLRNVIRSAVEGDLLEMTLGDPVAVAAGGAA